MEEKQIKNYTGVSFEEIYKNIEEDKMSDQNKLFNIIEERRRNKYLFFLRKKYICKVAIEESIQPFNEASSLIERLEEQKRKKQSELTSSVKTQTEQIKNMPVKPFEPVQTNIEEKRIKQYLLHQEVKPELIDKWISEIKLENNHKNIHWKDELNKKIKNLFKDEIDISGAVIALFGPTGVGKTTTLIKRVTELMEQGKSVGVISTDSYRVGAYEQMEMYSLKLNFPLVKADIQDLNSPINYLKYKKNVDVIFIDTSGRSAADEKMKDDIINYLDQIKPDNTSLVLAANQKYSDMSHSIQSYNNVQINDLIITKLDETMTYGFMINLMVEFEKTISFVTTGQVVPKDIEKFTYNQFLNRLWANYNE